MENFAFTRLNLRFKFSEEYLQNNKSRFQVLSERRGNVLYETGDCYAVRFDGTKSTQYYHKRFIEIIANDHIPT